MQKLNTPDTPKRTRKIKTPSGGLASATPTPPGIEMVNLLNYLSDARSLAHGVDAVLHTLEIAMRESPAGKATTPVVVDAYRLTIGLARSELEAIIAHLERGEADCGRGQIGGASSFY